MSRRFSICAVLALFAASGCTTLGKARGHERAADKALKADKHAECGEEYTKAIADYKKVADSWSPETPRHWWGFQGMADSYRGRALCRKGQGDIAAAVSDLEETVKLYSQYSQQNRDIFYGGARKSMAQGSADVSETLAKWKKELAATSVVRQPR
jgi:hypothetical protein